MRRKLQPNPMFKTVKNPEYWHYDFNTGKWSNLYNKKAVARLLLQPPKNRRTLDTPYHDPP